MTRLQELNQELETVKNEIATLKAENKIDEAHARLSEIENLKKEIEIENELEEKEIIEERKDDVKMEKEIRNDAFALRSVIKAMNKVAMTDEEREVANTYKNVTGESYILPSEVSTKIVEFVREYKSFENVVGVKTTTALSGSFPVDKTVDVELEDFVDGTGINDSDNLEFGQVTFALKEKGAIIPLTNTLLKFTDNDLINFVAKKFARRYVATINKMAVEALKKDKTVKAYADIKAVVKSSQKDLDPSVAGVIVTNQSGFQKLAEGADLKGVSYVQPDLTKPATMVVDGRPVVVFSDKQLANRVDAGKNFAPVFMGNLAEGAWIVKAGNYDFALGDDFRKNLTLTRIIAYVDAIQVDGADENYVVGELAL